MKPQYLRLSPNIEDEKRWVAEITGKDETFIVKRDFQPEKATGMWEIYDGWYQIHGQAAGVTPFKKEYVRVKDGRMARGLGFRYVLEHIEEIIANEPERMDRLKQQIKTILDEIKIEAPYEQVAEAIDSQKEELDMVETSEQLLDGLKALLKRKEGIVKTYNDALKDQPFEW